VKIVSLFSGAGGLDLGLHKAGHQIVFANDNFIDAANTYKKNLNLNIDVRDIEKIPSSEIPNCDIVVGGFPCQGFSVANWNRRAADPRNKMYLELLRVIKAKNPNFILCENVPGLLSLEKGEIFKRITDELTALGYIVRYSTLSAADYGVPQIRRRVFIFCQKNSIKLVIPFPPKPTHKNPILLNGHRGRAWVSVGECLKKYPEPNKNETDFLNHQGSKYKLRFNGHLGHRFVDPKKPAPTVTARGDEKGGVVVLHHPKNHRRITVREMAAIQSFPDEFYFVGTNTSCYRQIANSVPPRLSYIIGLWLKGYEKR
jgi:DNA (cytosine-5)-methyltransferase 1